MICSTGVTTTSVSSPSEADDGEHALARGEKRPWSSSPFSASKLPSGTTKGRNTAGLNPMAQGSGPIAHCTPACCKGGLVSDWSQHQVHPESERGRQARDRSLDEMHGGAKVELSAPPVNHGSPEEHEADRGHRGADEGQRVGHHERVEAVRACERR